MAAETLALDLPVLGAGIVVLGLAIHDFLRSTIVLSGVGPVTRRIERLLWAGLSRLVPAIQRRTGLDLRVWVGPVILVAIAATWIILHLLGYGLIYAAGLSLEDPEGRPVSFLQKLAFAGSSLSTLGAAPVETAAAGWNMVSMIAALNGMVVLTLSIGFISAIQDTVLRTRHLALRLHAARTAAQGSAQALWAVTPLSAELADVALRLSANPLAVVFVPRSGATFAAELAWLCAALETATKGGGGGPGAAGTLQALHEYRAALDLLERHVPPDPGAPPARWPGLAAWARRYSFPALPG